MARYTSPTRATSATSLASSIPKASYLIDFEGYVIPLLDHGSQAQRTGPFSPDEKTLYISDNGAAAPGVDRRRPRRPRQGSRTPGSSTTSAQGMESTA